MKRLLLLLALLLGAAATAGAQKGLQIAAYFGSDYQKRADATEVLLGSDALKPYRLTLFRSLTLKADLHEAERIEKAIARDTRNAQSREQGKRAGRLYYGYYELPKTSDGLRRYIFYRNNALQAGSDGLLTLIYMEGHATMSFIRKSFAK